MHQRPTTFRPALILLLIALLLSTQALYAQPMQQAPPQGQQNGEGGGDAAGILFGLAAVMAPIAAAITQMSVAQSEADANLRMTQISADAARYQAKEQAKLTAKMAADQLSIARENNATLEAAAIRENEFALQQQREQIAALERREVMLAQEREMNRRMQAQQQYQAMLPVIQNLQQRQQANFALGAAQAVQNNLVPGGAGANRLTTTNPVATAQTSAGNPISTAIQGGTSLGATRSLPTIRRGAAPTATKQFVPQTRTTSGVKNFALKKKASSLPVQRPSTSALLSSVRTLNGVVRGVRESISAVRGTPMPVAKVSRRVNPLLTSPKRGIIRGSRRGALNRKQGRTSLQRFSSIVRTRARAAAGRPHSRGVGRGRAPASSNHR